MANKGIVIDSNNNQKRHIGAAGGIALVLGIVVGSGIFRLPSVVAANTSSLWWFYSLWIVGGVVTICLARSLSVVCKRTPVSAADYVILKDSYGFCVGFTYVWMILWLNPYIWSILALIASDYLLVSTGFDSGEAQYLAIVLIWAIAGAHALSIRWSIRIQAASTWLKVALLVFAVLLMLLAPAAIEPIAGSTLTDQNLGVAFAAVMFAYGGLPVFATMVGEMRLPERSIPTAMIGAATVITAIYVAANFAFVRSLGLAGLAESKAIVVDALEYYGNAGSRILGGLVFLAALSGLNAIVLTTPRIIARLFRDLKSSRLTANRTSDSAVPVPAIFVSALLATVYLLVTNLGEMVSAFILGLWPFYILLVGTIFLRKSEKYDLSRRSFLDSLTAGVFVVAASIFILFLAVRSPGLVGVQLGVIALGVATYWLVRHKFYSGGSG